MVPHRSASAGVPGRSVRFIEVPPPYCSRSLTRVQRLPHLWSAGSRLRAPAVHRLRVRATRPLLLQGPGLLPELRRTAYDGVRRPPRRRGAAAGARAPVGAESSASSSLSAGGGPRAGARGARRVRAGAPGLPAPPRAPVPATPISWMPAGAEPCRLSRAATRSDPTRDRPLPFGRRLARRAVRRRAASGRSAKEWPRSRTAAAERRARSRERNAPLRSRNPGSRRRGRPCSRAHTRMSARPQRAPVRARTILCESRARVPRIRQRGPSSRSARSALRLPCAGPRDSRARAAHSSRECTATMRPSLRASAAGLRDKDAARLRGVRGCERRTADRPARSGAARDEPTPAGRCRAAGSCRRRHLAHPLAEAPAVALEVERLVGANAPEMVAQPAGDPCTRGDRALVVRIDVGDVHADVLALDAGTLRADRTVRALPADADHAVAELDQCVEEHASLAHHPRGRDLAEPERALQERERGADVLVRKLGNDRRSAPGLDRLPDCRHEHRLSPVERRRLERGLAPQLPRQVHRLHRDLTLVFPFGLISSRRCARARLSRERTVPIGSARASATLWYESSSHAKSRSASRSPSGSVSIASATRENSTRASSARAFARPSAASRPAAIRALARSRRASPRRCFSNRFEPIPYSHGSALRRDASNVMRRSNAIRNSSPTNPSATLAPARRPKKRSRVAAWRS